MCNEAVDIDDGDEQFDAMADAYKSMTFAIALLRERYFGESAEENFRKWLALWENNKLKNEE